MHGGWPRLLEFIRTEAIWATKEQDAVSAGIREWHIDCG